MEFDDFHSDRLHSEITNSARPSPRLSLSLSLSNQVWIGVGDIILVGLRDYQDKKADVIQKYNPDEARNLKAYGELPETARINETNFGDIEEEDGIEFVDISESEHEDADYDD